VKRALPLAEPSCGSCNVCCVEYGIDGVKRAGERCQHLVGGEHGCDRYDTRPRACAEYRCAYLTGAVRVRPDALGVVVRETAPVGAIRVLHVEECVPGGLQSWAWCKERSRLAGAMRGSEYVMWSRRGVVSSNATRVQWHVTGETLLAVMA